MPQRQDLDAIAGDSVVQMVVDFSEMDAPDICQSGVFRDSANLGQHGQECECAFEFELNGIRCGKAVLLPPGG
ncbi:hypothetical protein ASF04_04800 [Duganella sp. Leaf61]|nr:hypothetical protein [Duganella sp. Leaf61]KQN75397.1 hypothetical protein ASF04_04800 [Duganella sp. Leaf61]